MVHVYNAWLPPPVVDVTAKEGESFHAVVQKVMSEWSPNKPNSALATLKWIPILQNFIQAKSEISLDDVRELVIIGLDLFFQSRKYIVVQIRWGILITRFLRKFGKKLHVILDWQPFYDLLVETHFTRQKSIAGLRPMQHHADTVTSLVSTCRRFFSSGSAAQIWQEFRPEFENPWHNSSLEAAGFLQLFLPTNKANIGFFDSDWVKDCLSIWIRMPNCVFWDFQWAALMARCIKKCHTVDWDSYLPTLFTHYLNIIEVPVARNKASFPYSRKDVPHKVISVFGPRRLITPTKEIAKSIIYLLKPGGGCQPYFERLVSLLEQYYHPSNGGGWSSSLERLLRYLIYYFKKRLAKECSKENNDMLESFLGSTERKAFVKAVLKLIERGQYSKNEFLSETTALAASTLSYVEPTIVLPFIISSYHVAVDNVTSPHQFKSAVLMLAFASRAFLLSSGGAVDIETVNSEDYKHVLTSCMCNTLSGMDANDPPKTLATMQLYGSIFSSLAGVSDNVMRLGFDTSEWLDEFLCRLFSLLLYLEPSSQLTEGEFLETSSGTFLVDGPFYFCLSQILIGKLTGSVYQQALKKISKFVHGHILPGAVEEVGLLCSSAVYSNPKEAFPCLVKPIITSVLSALKECPLTGYANEKLCFESFSSELSLSPAVEESISYQLNVLSEAISYSGSMVYNYKHELNEVILSSFNAPSWKVNKAGNRLLRSLIGCLILYYPLDEYMYERCTITYPSYEDLEKWVSTKEVHGSRDLKGPEWHIPNKEEIAFANELLDTHLRAQLNKLKDLFETKNPLASGSIKNVLRVTLLQIDASLQGARSCLPDFNPMKRDDTEAKEDIVPPFIVGASGATVGDTELRELATELFDQACKFMLENVADNSMLLILLVQILDVLANYGSLEYDEWVGRKEIWKTDSSAITEPPINFITGHHAQSKRRPRWAIIDMAFVHNLWRSSQSNYHIFHIESGLHPSKHAVLLMDNLLTLSVNDYATVRKLASKSLIKMVKRMPSLAKDCISKLISDLQAPEKSENGVIGACNVLSSRVVMRHIMKDWGSFSSFLLSILRSSHHDTLRCQNAINELYLLFDMRFTEVPKIKYDSPESGKSEYSHLIAQIKALIDEMQGMNLRYILMAHRMLFLLAFPSNDNSEILSETKIEVTCHFLLQLKSSLPPVRVLSSASLVTLIQATPYRDESSSLSKNSIGSYNPCVEVQLPIYEEGSVRDMLSSLSYDHIFPDESNHTIPQRMQDISLFNWLQTYYAPWPRSRNWSSFLRGSAFLPGLAKLFKCLIQEGGNKALQVLQRPLEELVTKEEPGKQCVAAEVLAGILHSDVSDIAEAWDNWIHDVLKKGLLHSTVQTTPEWVAGVRFAVTGKGRNGRTVPVMRQRVIECLAEPLAASVSTRMVAKRFTLLCAVLVEISPPSSTDSEMIIQKKLLDEVISSMDHSVAQVRESVGDLLGVLVSNVRISQSSRGYAFANADRSDVGALIMDKAVEVTRKIQGFSQSLSNGQSVHSNENDTDNKELDQSIKWLETAFNFVISALRSGRASVLSDIIVGLLYPILSLQETSHKELSNVARRALHLLGWQIISRPNLSNAVDIIISSSNDSSWHTRLATLKFLQSFMYRHAFLLTNSEAERIWNQAQQLLTDNQVEVREQAASVLSGLTRAADISLVKAFHDNAHKEAAMLLKKIKSRNSNVTLELPIRHGAVLALASLVLSFPYDIPDWLPDTITLLAQFIGEPYPIKSTVMKTIAEFRRTHADTWNIQKEIFTEDQLEVLADSSSSLSYFS